MEGGGAFLLPRRRRRRRRQDKTRQEGKGRASEHQARIIRLVTYDGADCRTLDYCTVLGLTVLCMRAGGREAARGRCVLEKGSSSTGCITLV